MEENRRSFLKKAGCAAAGLGCGFPLLGAGCGALSEASADAEASGTQWGMVVDVRKCLRREVRDACTEACHQAHNVPQIDDPKEEVKWIWPEEYEHVFPDQAHAHTESALQGAPVLVLCNHCTKPSCVRVCPTKATWKRESDGVVMMDMHRCIGCRYCIAACPYGARSFNWRDPREHVLKDADGNWLSNFPTRSKGVVEKCNFCAERMPFSDDRKPACVAAANAVPEGKDALTFGDLNDPGSEIRGILSEKHTIARRIGLGTGPNVFYIV